jgi:hypothetical protein
MIGLAKRKWGRDLLARFVGAIVAGVANGGMTLLRDRVNVKLSREEVRFSKLSFSQFGEDLAVSRWLDEQFPDAPHIYVDAGAFHPIHFSNTLLLKKRGWWGINIDMVASKIELRPTQRRGIEASTRPSRIISTEGARITSKCRASTESLPFKIG